MISTNIEENIRQLNSERTRTLLNAPNFPREIDSININLLLSQLRTETCEHIINNPKYSVIFKISNEDTSKIIRAIQEHQLLKTKIKLQGTTLRSFWQVWFSDRKFQSEITRSKDPNEEKWKLCRKYGYKMATTFMPCYAKAIYEYFGCPKIVLDPCSGWGDRLLGAEVAGIEKYIGFDPNVDLRPGYAQTMDLLGHFPAELSDKYIKFTNSYEIYSCEFQRNLLENDSVDFIFTSPPFFDYEIYNKSCPNYRDWISEFYEPLFINCARIVKPGCYVCMYLGDTSAGKIERFLIERVPEICNLMLEEKSIGFQGIWSGVIRKMWVFKKI